MSDDTPPVPTSRPRWLVPAIAAAGVVVVVVVALVVRSGSSSDGAAADPSASISVSKSAAPTPTLAPEPSVSASPSPADPAPVDPAPDAPTSGPDGRPTAPPVPIEAQAVPTPGVTVTLASIEAVTGEARLPGEIAGPALRVTVSVQNDAPTSLDLTSAVVNVYYGAGLTPALPLTEPGGSPFAGSVFPHASATGAYVFTVPADQRQLVRIEVDLAPDLTVLLYEGAVSA